MLLFRVAPNRRKFRREAQIRRLMAEIQKRPSVAFADYDITDRRTSMSATLILLYGTAHVLLGSVLTLADAFSSEKNSRESDLDHKYYLEIFLLLEYIISIFGIAILQVLLYISEKRSHAYRHHHDMEHCDEADTKSSTSLSNTFSKMWRTVKKGRISRKKRPKEVEFLTKSETEGLNSLPEPALKSPTKREQMESHKTPKRVITKTSFQVDVDSFSTIPSEPVSPNMSSHRKSDDPPSFNSHSYMHSRQGHMKMVYRDKEGVNLYLRLGAVGFGFGVMVYDGFKISDHLGAKSHHCLTPLWIPKFTVHFVYTFIQTYFIFKFHRMVFNCYKTMVRFILIHLATCNVVQWLKTIVFEIHEEAKREENHAYAFHASFHKALSTQSPMVATSQNMASTYFFTNSTTNKTHVDEPHMTSHQSCLGYSDKLSHYLFPCAIEYSLIAGAMCYKLYQKVEGDLGDPHALVCRHRELSGTSTGSSTSSLEHHVSSECHKSHRGIFMGMLLIVVTVVAMGLFFFLRGTDAEDQMSLYIYQITKILLQIISGSACMWAFYQIRDLKFRHLTEGEAFDANLLLIGFSGILVYNMFLVLPALESLKRDGGHLAQLYAIKAAFEMIQSLLQVFFIVEASRRCARDYSHVRNKPGRSLVTFLLVSNLALWIINTFLVKTADHSHTMHKTYYGDLPWNIVTSIFLPLIIFYRFHSTVCLSDIWVKCYELH